MASLSPVQVKRPPCPTYTGDFLFARQQPFALEAGGQLRDVTLRYAMYGTPNAARDNVVFVCHALSGSAEVHEWWPQLFDNLLRLDRYCVLGVNILGSCYGSTGPNQVNPETGEPYGAAFPLVSIGDIVRSQALLLDSLRIQRLKLAIGGSIGGMQALQWAMDYPDRVERAIAVGAAPLSAMGLALNHLQRQAIELDPAWQGGAYTDQKPTRGLAMARAMATCSYKSAELFDERFGRRENRTGPSPLTDLSGRFDVAGYLDYQGSRFLDRFDANSYLSITRTMDNFDPARSYGSEKAAYARIRAKIGLVGISSDWLFPAKDVHAMANAMQRAGADCEYCEQTSAHGHDAFLAEWPALEELLKPWID
jgi:homoserine O-acetyltransferase